MSNNTSASITRNTCDILYSKIQDESSMYELLKYPYDATLWSKWYKIYKNKNNMDAVKCLRRLVIRDTLKACELSCLRYNRFDPVKNKVEKIALVPSVDAIRDCAKNTRMYYDGTTLQWKRTSEMTANKTELTVVNEDCLSAALGLKSQGLNPVVLNNASMRRPGGGYMNGAGAQEENLFRRSTYSLSLVDGERLDDSRDWSYPIPEFGGIYSPDVMVFRDTEDNGYAHLLEPIPMSFIAVAAYVRPQLTLMDKKKKIYHLTHKFASKTKDKIRTILRIALLHGHDSVILGAFGCGAFCNPPEHVSMLFDQVLFEEEEFIGAFKHVCFAIIEDANSMGRAHNPNGNFSPFEKVFRQRSVQLEEGDNHQNENDELLDDEDELEDHI